MQSLKRVFISGTNRGIGKEFVKMVSEKYKDIELHASSRQKPEQYAQQLSKLIPDNKIKCHQINLRDSETIKNTVSGLQKDNVKFDFVIANAAQGCDWGHQIPSVDVATGTIKTNVDATIDFVKQFLPLLENTGRIIIVSSIMGRIDVHSEVFRNTLADPNVTEAKILEIGDNYIEAVTKNQMEGWNWSAYRVSKALINSWNRYVLPKYLKQGQSCVSMHPGWCVTDMGGPNGTSTALDGAVRIFNCMELKEIAEDQFFNQKFVPYHTCS